MTKEGGGPVVPSASSASAATLLLWEERVIGERPKKDATTVDHEERSWRVFTGGGCGIVAELPQNGPRSRRKRTVATRKVGPIRFEDGVRPVPRWVCREEEAPPPVKLRSVGGVVPVILINGWDRFVLILRQGGIVILFYCCWLLVVGFRFVCCCCLFLCCFVRFVRGKS